MLLVSTSCRRARSQSRESAHRSANQRGTDLPFAERSHDGFSEKKLHVVTGSACSSLHCHVQKSSSAQNSKTT